MVNFRQFRSADAEKCKTLISTCSEDMVRACAGGYDELATARQAEICDLIKNHLCRAPLDLVYCIVAEQDEQIIGMGVLDGQTIKRMYINPHMRGKGIGREIYQRL